MLRVAFLIIPLAILLIFAGLFNPQSAEAAGPCGGSYVVLPDDTIQSIADLCGTTVEAILDVNPEITNPNELFPGQIIRIPDAESEIKTIVAIDPGCGLAGQTLLIVGSGFPSNTQVALKLVQVESEASIAGSATSDRFGRIDTSMIIPSSAESGTIWFVSGEAQVSSAKFTGTSNLYHVIPSTPDPNASSTYIVQEGDTLRTIAVKFNRDLESLFRANPQITESGQLNTGDLVSIPAQETGGTVTRIAPICGPVETDIQVSGSGFPPVTNVFLSMGPYLTEYQPVGEITSGTNRTIQAQLTIPSTGRTGENWVVVASTSSFSRVRSTSNIYIITPPKDPIEPALYIVNPGDTLNQIAVEYNRSVAAILSVNPQITNPNQLTIGDKLIIPGQIETILVSPISGPAQTNLQAAGVGFPPFSAVTIGFLREDNIYNIEGAIGTDVNGFFNTTYSIPVAAQPGEVWNIAAIKVDASGNEIIARSNDFTVSTTQPLLEPNISVWPLDGPPGTEISIVGNNFPSLAHTSYTFYQEGFTPTISGTKWTEINGTFALDLVIPSTAAQGEIWLISAESLENSLISATSPPFTVTGQ